MRTFFVQSALEILGGKLFALLFGNVFQVHYVLRVLFLKAVSVLFLLFLIFS